MVHIFDMEVVVGCLSSVIILWSIERIRHSGACCPNCWLIVISNQGGIPIMEECLQAMLLVDE
jgi:hypothetical protein